MNNSNKNRQPNGVNRKFWNISISVPLIQFRGLLRSFRSIFFFFDNKHILFAIKNIHNSLNCPVMLFMWRCFRIICTAELWYRIKILAWKSHYVFSKELYGLHWLFNARCCSHHQRAIFLQIYRFQFQYLLFLVELRKMMKCSSSICPKKKNSNRPKLNSIALVRASERTSDRWWRKSHLNGQKQNRHLLLLLSTNRKIVVVILKI